MIRTSKTKLKRPLFDCLSSTATLKSLHELQKPPSPLPDFSLRRTVEKRKEKPYMCYVFFFFTGLVLTNSQKVWEQNRTSQPVKLFYTHCTTNQLGWVMISHFSSWIDRLHSPGEFTLCALQSPPKYQKCFSRPGAFMDVAWLMLFSDNIPLVLTRIFFHQSKVSETLVGDDFISPWPKYLNSRH